jgi:hypothetical protein
LGSFIDDAVIEFSFIEDETVLVRDTGREITDLCPDRL